MNKSRVYYLANGLPYTNGSVFSLITEKDWDIIVGLDFGHGETVAFKCSRSNPGVWVHTQLKIGPNRETELPSYLCYNADGNAVIGGDARDSRNFFPYFKIEPGRWPLALDQAGHSFGQVTRDFLAEVWRNILRYDDEIRLATEEGSGKKLLLAAGCPSSSLWLSPESIHAYHRLLSGATGCEHIEILPESTAAIMMPILAGKGDADAGIAIFDLGSLTTDFTYVCMGKKMVVQSLPLGGADLDRAMLRKLLRDNGISREELSFSQQAHACARLRETKERYYRTHMPTSWEAIQLTEDRWCRFRVDADFIREVLEEDREILIPEADYENHSWLECLKMFVERARLRIGDAPCARVLLTGGTSRIDEVQTICESVFSHSQVDREENPSVSVAKGLCYAKRLESRRADAIENLRELMQKTFQNQYSLLVSGFSDAVVNDVWPMVVALFWERAQKDEDCLVRDLMADLKARFLNNQAQVEQMLLEQVTAALEACQDAIVPAVNQLSDNLYRTTLSCQPVSVELDPELADAVMKTFDMGIFIQELAVSTMISADKASANLYYAGAAALVSSAGWAAIGAAIVGIKAAEALWKHWERNNQTVSRRKLKKIARATTLRNHDDLFRYLEVKERFEGGISGDVFLMLSENQLLRESFMGLCNELLETAIGKILFLVFEEKPLL